MRDAKIEILASAAVDGATVEEVLAYLEEAYRILGESRSSANTGQTEEQGVAKEVVTPAPSATPATCTALPAGTTFDARTVPPASVSIKAGGLIPGETLILIVERYADRHSSRHETHLVQAVGAGGSFSTKVGGLDLAE